MEPRGTTEANRSMAPYMHFVRTAWAHTLVALPRKRMSYLAAIITFTPVLIPLALTLPDDMWYDPDGSVVFNRIGQLMYVSALCPLLALLFGSSLIGEDVEQGTFPYILTRPIPRSAWVLGKFLGYWTGVSALLLSSLAVTYLCCTLLSKFSLTASTLLEATQFGGALAMGLGAYGALALALGVLTKRPMVWGVMLIFGWERFALWLPGYPDFFTIGKYVAALLPREEGAPSLWEMLVEAMEIERLILTVGPWTSLAALMGITAGFVAFGAWVAKHREFTNAHSVGS